MSTRITADVPPDLTPAPGSVPPPVLRPPSQRPAGDRRHHLPILADPEDAGRPVRPRPDQRPALSVGRDKELDQPVILVRRDGSQFFSILDRQALADLLVVLAALHLLRADRLRRDGKGCHGDNSDACPCAAAVLPATRKRYLAHGGSTLCWSLPRLLRNANTSRARLLLPFRRSAVKNGWQRTWSPLAPCARPLRCIYPVFLDRRGPAMTVGGGYDPRGIFLSFFAPPGLSEFR